MSDDTALCLLQEVDANGCDTTPSWVKGYSKPCAKCNAIFTRPKKISAQHWESRIFCSKKCAGYRRSLSDSEIVDLYNSGKSTTEVGALAGVSKTQVQRIIRPLGITRSPRECQKLRCARPEVRSRMSLIRTGIPCLESVKEKLRCLVGSKNSLWISGITMNAQGYLCFTDSVANGENRQKAIHVIIAEWSIGRPLREGEVVHHKDEDKQNNHPDNLEVFASSSDHARHHAIKNRLGHRK